MRKAYVVFRKASTLMFEKPPTTIAAAYFRGSNMNPTYLLHAPFVYATRLANYKNAVEPFTHIIARVSQPTQPTSQRMLPISAIDSNRRSADTTCQGPTSFNAFSWLSLSPNTSSHIHLRTRNGIHIRSYARMARHHPRLQRRIGQAPGSEAKAFGRSKE
jgi:hypothetical protein